MASKIESLQGHLDEALKSFGLLSRASSPDERAIETSKARIHFISSQLAAETADPLRTFTRIGLIPGLTTAVRVAIELGLPTLIDAPMTLEDIAQRTNSDSVLIRRLMRVMTAFNIFEEVGEQEYTSNRLSQTLNVPPIRDWVKSAFDVHLPIMQKIPAYLASTQYQNPQSDSHSLAHNALGKNFFEYLQEDEDRQVAFDSSMKMQDLAPTIAVPKYPFDTELQKSSPEADGLAALVDIGGGHGQFLETTKKEFPNLAVEFILQDTKPATKVLEGKEASFRIMVYNFFTPQPVVGARWYHLRRILHDWPDMKCREILENVKPGFKKGYSRVLLNEYVLPEKGCTQEEGLVDICVMTLNAMERTKRQWEVLLESAGFSIVKIWPAQKGSLSIIEADLKD